MHKLIIGTLIVLLAILFATTQVLASPLSVPQPANGIYQANTPRPTQDSSAPSVLHSRPRLYRGTINQVDSSGIALLLADNSPVTINLIPSTRVLVPGSVDTGNSSLSAGMQAAVVTLNDQNNQPVAQIVLIIPQQPLRSHHVGKVTAYTPGVSIAIQGPDGAAYTFNLNGSTKVIPEPQASALAVGSPVTIISPNLPFGETAVAIGIVVHSTQ